MEIGEKTVVVLKYTGKLEDGTVFDSSEGRKPLEFVFGKNMIIPGLEAGIKGMKKGDTKTVEIEPKDAYGEYHEQAVQEVPKDQFPEDKLVVGAQFVAETQAGQRMFVVKEIKDSTVVVDFNHMLAGKKLIFDVEVVDVNEESDNDVDRIHKEFHENLEEAQKQDSKKQADSE